MNMLVNVKQKLLAVFYSPRRRVVVSVFLFFCFFFGFFLQALNGFLGQLGHATPQSVVYYMEDAM